MLTELSDRQSNGTHHVQAPSTGGARHQIGARRLNSIGMLRGMALKHGERRLFERRERSRARIGGTRAFLDGGGVEIFEVCDELVDGRIRQLDSGLRDVPPDLNAGIE